MSIIGLRKRQRSLDLLMDRLEDGEEDDDEDEENNGDGANTVRRLDGDGAERFERRSSSDRRKDPKSRKTMAKSTASSGKNTNTSTTNRSRALSKTSDGLSLAIDAMDQLKAAAFRILTHLCLNNDALHQIYDLISVDQHILPLLQPSIHQLVQREVIGLLVQLTTPLIDYWRTDKIDNTFNHFISNLPLDDLVYLLTGILSYAPKDVLLLSGSGQYILL